MQLIPLAHWIGTSNLYGFDIGLIPSVYRVVQTEIGYLGYKFILYSDVTHTLASKLNYFNIPPEIRGAMGDLGVDQVTNPDGKKILESENSKSYNKYDVDAVEDSGPKLNDAPLQIAGTGHIPPKIDTGVGHRLSDATGHRGNDTGVLKQDTLIYKIDPKYVDPGTA